MYIYIVESHMYMFVCMYICTGESYAHMHAYIYVYMYAFMIHYYKMHLTIYSRQCDIHSDTSAIEIAIAAKIFMLASISIYEMLCIIF